MSSPGSGPRASSARSMPTRSRRAMDDYTRYNGRRKPELLEPTTFSLTNYGEADRVEREWRTLEDRVDKLATELPESERASLFELVQYPVDASAKLTEMYITAGRMRKMRGWESRRRMKKPPPAADVCTGCGTER